MRYFTHRSNRVFSVIITALFVLCAGTAWGETFTINCNTSSSDELFSVSGNGTQYDYDSRWTSYNLIKMDKGESITITNVTGATITAISAQGVADNNSNQTVNFTITDGTTNVTTSSGSWNNRKTATSLTNKNFNSVSGLKHGEGQTYTITNNTSSSYNAGVRFVITYTPATPACVAPSSVAIGGNWLWFAGETMTLTATPTGGNGPITYQWYKGGKADGNAIDGATSATYTKTSCTCADAGSYYCKVTCGGTQSTWGQNGDAYDVKIPRLYVKTGHNYDPVKTDYGNVDFTRATASTATASISLDSNWDYCFNIADGCGNYYGNSGTMQYNNYGPWVTNVNGTDCGLTTMNANAGTYIFTINYSNWTQLQTTVTFPSSPTTKTVYMKINYGNWEKGDERYAIYCFGSGEQWYNFTLVDGACGGPIYKAEVDLKYTGYVICRMNGATTENNWGNKWDQTYDITAANGMYCTITGMSGGKANYTYNNKPFSVCVSGNWLAFKGETITLTATCTGASNFQWYKGGTAESNKIAGATSATYTKTNCDITDAGNYYCKAWNVTGSANETWSSAYGVKVPYLEYKTRGTGSDNVIVPFLRGSTSNEWAYCTVYPGVAWGYEFAVKDGHSTYGNTGTKDRGNSTTKWTMSGSTWCKWDTDKEGTYHFYLDFSNSVYEPLEIHIDYPLMSQMEGHHLYMEKTAEMVAAGWNNIYYRIGKGKYDDGDGRNYTKAYLMTLVPGTARFYETTTPDWSNNFWAWHIANNCGSQGDGFAIYQTHSSSEYEITQSINFDGDEIEGDSTYYVHIGSGDGTGTDWLNDNCIFRGHSATAGMLQHNASVAATTHGKLRIEYKHYDNTDHSSEANTARNFNGLAHTCILTITGVPDCGYKVDKIIVNGTEFTSSSIQHILDADATISATFTDDTYSITLNRNGGTINSGNVTSYTHGTGATLPTDVTKSSYGFGGWYDNAGFTGSPVTSISASDCGDKEFYAKWIVCPNDCSGETLYKFEVNSSVSGGNICSSGNNPKTLTTPTQLSVLTGGSLEGYITNNSSWNNLTFASGRITYANNDRGVLILTLNCPIQEGDLIRFNNYSSSNSKYNYLRHTSNSTTSGQLTLNASRTETEIQQIEATAAFEGKTTLYIVPGERTTGISYFEIIRPAVVTLNANGGTVDGNATKEMKAALSESIALPHAFKDGLRFKGWFDAPTGGSPAGDAYTVTGCTTLYAQYEDCPDRGLLYKFEVGTGLTNGAVTASNVAFDFNTSNYLTTLIGGSLTTDGATAHKVLIANNNAISINASGAYLKVELDCELEEGDIFKSTITDRTIWVTKSGSTPSAADAVLPIGDLQQTPIPASLIGEKTLYLWKGSGGDNKISYFEITRPSQTIITLSAPGATNSYTTSVTATLGSAMPEIAVLPIYAGYVFQGYYDGVGGTGTQYYSATGESLRNWDKDVPTATLYAKWQTPCEVEPTLTNVAPVVTIWDQHPVDISLVRLSCPFDTTGILHFTLASVSPTDPIPGCHFEYFDDYIHIMGTPTVYNTTVQTVDITFTITNDCSPAVTATITQTIQIYPKDQKARIAFIVTGTEGGAFNACTSGNMTSCNTLVTYLRNFYTVDFVNGYASKDPATLAAYYDDYDLLVVTDFLNTGKGYTNAIGTLIDKKPILSFEAYVANQSNWHIGSNPKDPDPKVQDMKVLCAGHAIFKDDSYYGTPVDVVNNTDTTVHVLDALSSEDDAKGLQGFVINEAPDFIFLATVRDNNHNRDLIVCCERQVVFPARLMLFGVNFYEMPNLSSAGQIIIRQMIDYLLMTDETKIADCSLVFDNGRDNTGYDETAYHAAGGTGHKGDGLWTTAANWAPGYNIIPTPYHPTRIIAECHVNVDDAHAGSVKVNKGRDEHGEIVDGKLIVEPYGGLTVAGIVAKVNDTRYASPTAIKAEDLLIKADENNNGAFVYGNKESDVRATVEYYSRGDKANTANPVWQYMGIPFRAGKTAISMYYAAWMCRWSETTTDNLGGLWEWVDNEDVLLPFEGYCITQAATKTYVFDGKLNPPTTVTLALDNRDGDGYAFAANSWTAPIKIQEMADEDFVNAERAIYIYHTGTYAEWEVKQDEVINTNTSAATPIPGQYTVIPIHSSPYIGVDSVIPAMQGFFIKTDPALNASLALVYNRVVYDAHYFKTSTQPMRAPGRTATAPVVMRLLVSGEAFGADQVHLLTRGEFTDAFEDGWDGRKIEGDTDAPMLAVIKAAGDMSVAALPTADERYLNFRAGRDSVYTFYFDYEGDNLFLYDRLTNQATLIRTGNSYSFQATNQEAAARFIITSNPHRTPTDIDQLDADADETMPVKFLYKGNVYIRNRGVVYDVTGKEVTL